MMTWLWPRCPRRTFHYTRISHQELPSMSPAAEEKTDKVKYLFLMTTVLVGGSFLAYNMRLNIIAIYSKPFAWVSQRHNVNFEHSYTINTEGCNIPALKPFDEIIKPLVKYPTKKTPCPNSTIALLANDNKRIWIRKENILYYNVTHNDTLSCCYQSFYRPAQIKDITSAEIDKRVKYGICKNFNDTISVADEFARVKCSVRKKIIYDQYFLFAPKKKFIKHNNKGEITKNKSAYNVLVLGIDTVSRLNFHRTMPKTASYLENKGAVELLGYNKVGDNTFPNLMAMLLGLKDIELKNTCLPHNNATFDNCPFIWEWFKQAGYYTALGEDSSMLGTFNFFKVGFSNTPTDYYLHTFIHEAEHHVGKNKDLYSYLCMNEKYFYKVLLDYIEKITSTLSNKKMFGFFWEVTMSHDYLNYPMTMDNDYVELFHKLETSGYLNSTILFLVSDHGMRWGKIRSTKQGRLEERLPFLFILPPISFQENYKEAHRNLKQNSKRLTSPFDLHATLMDLTDLKNVNNAIIASRSTKSYANERGISMFLPIPGNRTCAMAGIEDHWCTCLRDITLSKNSSVAIEVASNLVALINSLLNEYPQCSKLVLSELLDVTEIEVSGSDKSDALWREFVVVIRTSPGDGIFEATLRNDKKTWKLTGTPSRLNLYGNQSRCVNNSQMKLYCYCN